MLVPVSVGFNVTYAMPRQPAPANVAELAAALCNATSSVVDRSVSSTDGLASADVVCVRGEALGVPVGSRRRLGLNHDGDGSHFESVPSDAREARRLVGSCDPIASPSTCDLVGLAAVMRLIQILSVVDPSLAATVRSSAVGSSLTVPDRLVATQVAALQSALAAPAALAAAVQTQLALTGSSGGSSAASISAALSAALVNATVIAPLTFSVSGTVVSQPAPSLTPGASSGASAAVIGGAVGGAIAAISLAVLAAVLIARRRSAVRANQDEQPAEAAALEGEQAAPPPAAASAALDGAGYVEAPGGQLVMLPPTEAIPVPLPAASDVAVVALDAAPAGITVPASSRASGDALAAAQPVSSDVDKRSMSLPVLFDAGTGGGGGSSYDDLPRSPVPSAPLASWAPAPAPSPAAVSSAAVVGAPGTRLAWGQQPMPVVAQAADSPALAGSADELASPGDAATTTAVSVDGPLADAGAVLVDIRTDAGSSGSAGASTPTPSQGSHSAAGRRRSSVGSSSVGGSSVHPADLLSATPQEQAPSDAAASGAPAAATEQERSAHRRSSLFLRQESAQMSGDPVSAPLSPGREAPASPSQHPTDGAAAVAVTMRVGFGSGGGSGDDAGSPAAAAASPATGQRRSPAGSPAPAAPLVAVASAPAQGQAGVASSADEDPSPADPRDDLSA